jgi:hypothetical protein
MRKGIMLAEVLLVSAALAGCAIQIALPAFLLPGGGAAAPSQPTATSSPAVSAAPSNSAAATPTPSPTPVPTETPSPAPSAPPAESEPYKVLARYASKMPEGLPVDLKYSKYSTPLDYFVALKSGKVYAEPDTNSKKLASFSLGGRYRVDTLVQGTDGKSKWYHVLWSDKKGAHGGYVKESAGAARSFRVGMMLQQAQTLAQNADQPDTVYVTNRKNQHGLPPKLPAGKTVDPYNNRRDQSAPAYAEPDAKSAFRYAPDGMLGTKTGESGGFARVYFPSFCETRWVPDKYLSKQSDCIQSLTQVVVVDRKNQNSGTFEYKDGKWTLVALTYVSTGKQGGYYVKTPLGFFMAQEKTSKFYYYYDGTHTVEGYAPYAIRFSGGGYLHGVPRVFHYDEMGDRVDPGLAESLRSLGTTPQSHMCIRNYTSWAKFLYDWYKKGQCAVIVFE